MNGRSFINELFTKGSGWRRGYSHSLPIFIPLTCDWLIYRFYLSALVYLFPFFFSFFLFYLFPLFPLFLSPKRDCMRGSVEYYNSFLEIRDLSDVLGTRVLCEKYSFTNPPFLFFSFFFFVVFSFSFYPPPPPTPDSQVSVFLCDSSRTGLFLMFLAFSLSDFPVLWLYFLIEWCAKWEDDMWRNSQWTEYGWWGTVSSSSGRLCWLWDQYCFSWRK